MSSSTQVSVESGLLFNGNDYLNFDNSLFENFMQAPIEIDLLLDLIDYSYSPVSSRFVEQAVVGFSTRILRAQSWIQVRYLRMQYGCTTRYLTSSTQVAVEINPLFNGIDYPHFLLRARFEELDITVEIHSLSDRIGLLYVPETCLRDMGQR